MTVRSNRGVLRAHYALPFDDGHYRAMLRSACSTTQIIARAGPSARTATIRTLKSEPG